MNGRFKTAYKDNQNLTIFVTHQVICEFPFLIEAPNWSPRREMAPRKQGRTAVPNHPFSCTSHPKSTLHRTGFARILPEVVHVAVGVGHQVGIVLVAEVVLQDGSDQKRQMGVAGIGGVVEAVLAGAV